MGQILSSFPGGKSSGQYVWKKFTAENGKFLSLVVDDSKTAYPDGGMKAGYWYELLEEGVNIGSFGCSKYAVDTLIVSSDTKLISANFMHGLTDFPKFVLIRADESIESNDYVKAVAICYGDLHDNSYIENRTEVYGYGGVEYYGGESNPGSVEYIYCSATISTFVVSGGEGYGYKLKAGVPYTILTLG